ncbi:MAG: chorismate mutase [Patescibacteria group bacterium]
MNTNASATLVRLRHEIDAVDRRLLMLMAKRQKLVLEVGKQKRTNGIPVTDIGREQVIISVLQKQGRILGLTDAFIRGLMTIIFKESKRVQKGKI